MNYSVHGLLIADC